MIPAGSKVVCENGHAIGTLNRDLHAWSLFNSHVLDWVVAPTASGTLITSILCPNCVAKWVRIEPRCGIELHVDGVGWIGAALSESEEAELHQQFYEDLTQQRRRWWEIWK